jgi:hypothetical protein
MNLHQFLDHYTVFLGGLLTGRRKFFSQSVDSPDFAALLDTTSVELPPIAEEGIYEVSAESPVGPLDPAFYVAQWLGPEHPTLIYHHGNNERPFDFGAFSKNTFKNIILDHRQTFKANLIALRAPFHRSLRTYMERMTELRNFAAMLAVSVKLTEELVQWSRAQDEGTNSVPVLLTGPSLGGWITNLHRAYYNSADFYAPMMAGAALDQVFLTSTYRRLTGPAAREDPEAVRQVLNFEESFAAVSSRNVAALLMRHDAIIEYERQRQCYDPACLTVHERGHTTGVLDYTALRAFLLAQLSANKSLSTNGGAPSDTQQL